MVVFSVLKERVKSIMDEGHSEKMMDPKYRRFNALRGVWQGFDSMYEAYFVKGRDNLMGIGKCISLGRVVSDDPILMTSTYAEHVLILIVDLFRYDMIISLKHYLSEYSMNDNTANELRKKINELLDIFLPDASINKKRYLLRCKYIKKLLNQVDGLIDQFPQNFKDKIRYYL